MGNQFNTWFKRSMVALAALTLCIAAPVWAQEDETNDVAEDVNEVVELDVADAPRGDRPTGLNRGDWSLAIGTNLIHDVISRTDNLTTYTLSARLAYSYADNLRIGGLTELLVIDSGSTAHRFQIAGRATYHFDLDDQYRFVPYAGGGVGLTSLDDGARDEFGPSLHGVIGAEYHIQGDGVFRNTSLFAEYSPDVVFYGGDFGATFRSQIIAGIGIHW